MNLYKFYQENYIDPELQSNPNIITSLSKASPLHTHDFYEFFLIIEGSCLHQINGKTQYLETGALVFIRPNDVHCYAQNGNDDCQFINIPCRTEIIDSTFLYLGNSYNSTKLIESSLPCYTLLTTVAIERFILLYEKMIMFSSVEKSQSRFNLLNLLVEIFVQYFSNTDTIQEKTFPLWFEILLIKMQKKENFTKGLSTMQEISEKSIGHLDRIFQHYLNLTPTHYINNLRLNYAKSLLATTTSSATDICYEVGFGNLSHFYHLFKLEYKMSPLEYRNRFKVR